MEPMISFVTDDAPRKAFYAALAKAQGAIQGAAKTQTNEHFDSNYADLASVWNACRHALSSNGFSVMQLPDYIPESSVAQVETILSHEAGYSCRFITRIPVGQKSAHAVGSGFTYARRFALAAVVGVAPKDDDDGNGAEKKDKPEKTKPNGRGDLIDDATPWLERIKAAGTEDKIKSLKAEIAQNADRFTEDALTVIRGAFAAHIARKKAEVANAH